MDNTMEARVQQDYVQEILSLLRSGKSDEEIRDHLGDYHANDIAEALPELSLEERHRLYALLNNEGLAEVMEYSDEADDYLEELSPQRAAAILEEMEPDEAVDLLKETDSRQKKVWMSLMDPEDRRSLQTLASYDEDLIGSRMTTNFVALNSGLSIKEAMRSLIEQAADNDNISTLYVVGKNRSYLGAVELKDLIIARRDTKLCDITATSYPYVYANDRIEDCLEKLKDYSERSIPVLSDSKRILGVITAQDVIEVVDDEMGEDYAKLAGLTAEEDLKEPIRESIKKRLPWLMLLLVLGLVVSTVVGMFEAVVAKLTIIMAFQSLILDMAGNVGTQSLAVTIRVLMDEKLTGRQKLGLIGKEMTVGGLNGIILGFLALSGIGAYIALFKHLPLHLAFLISFCIGIALLLAMVISSFVGTAVPIFFKRVGVDPAAASGPLITTITDLVGVVTYYGLSAILLIDIMHMGAI